MIPSRIQRALMTPELAIGFFVTMTIIFSLLYWIVFPFVEGTPSLGYNANQVLSSRPITFLDCLYFSVTTQTTVGYGDVIPISVLGKISTMFQAAFGFVYLAFLIALFTSRAVKRSKQTEGPRSKLERDNKVLLIR